MSQTFEIGDTVMLKSGGPVMTIENIESNAGGAKVWCTWFDKNRKKETSVFNAAALESA